jgi:TIR domain
MKAFLSHSSKDKQIAREIADAIRVRGGDVWLDERELSVGSPLASALSMALGQIDTFMILVTENSVGSPWVPPEIDQVMPLVVERSIRIIPIQFGEVPIPPTLRGYLYANGSDRESLNRALNLAFVSAEYRLPLPQAELDRRYQERQLPEFCVRIVPTKVIRDNPTLGPTERRYVAVADYFEQCGRSLREILENLFVGSALEAFNNPDDEFSAIVFETGLLYEKKLDLMPGTWKSVYRIITDRRRLAILTPRLEFQSAMGRPPRDYWDTSYNWNSCVKDELQANCGSAETEEFLKDTFGIQTLNFSGNGRSHEGSRIFFTKNLALHELRWWRVDLGRSYAGNILN